MSEILTSCRDMMLKLVETHLTAKSHGRIHHVFNHYSDPDLLTQLYNPNGPFKPHLSKICNGLNKLIEEGKLWESGASGTPNSISLKRPTKCWTRRKQGMNFILSTHRVINSLSLCSNFLYILVHHCSLLIIRKPHFTSLLAAENTEISIRLNA